MIEDMENACHGPEYLCQEGLTARQLPPAMASAMVDYLAIAISHGLLLIAAWRLFLRTDLDADPEELAEQAARKAKSRRA